MEQLQGKQTQAENWDSSKKNKENESTTSHTDNSHSTAQAEIQVIEEAPSSSAEVTLPSCSSSKKDPKKKKKILTIDAMRKKLFNLEKNKKMMEIHYMQKEHEAKLHSLKLEHEERMRFKAREKEQMEELQLLKLKTFNS